MRDPAGEIRRAVDRIDDPDRLPRSGAAPARLLADEAIARKDRAETRRDQFLDLPVDFGQIIVRPLEADGEGGIDEAAARQHARLAGDRLGGEEARLIRIGVAHAGVLKNGCRRRGANVTRPPSGPMKLGGPKPSTASPISVTGTPAAAAFASKAGAELGAVEMMSS